MMLVILNAAIWLSIFYTTLQGEFKFALCMITKVWPLKLVFFFFLYVIQ